MLESEFSDKDYLIQEFLEESKAQKLTSSMKEPETYKSGRVQVILFWAANEFEETTGVVLVLELSFEKGI